MALTRPALLLLPAIVLVGASPAHAEGERALSGTLGWASFSTPGPTTKDKEPTTIGSMLGLALGGTYEMAIGSDFSLRGDVAGSLFHGGNTDTQSAVSYAALADVGATFRFDVLKYVPYAFGGVGGVITRGGPIGDQGTFVLAVGGGVDWLLDRAKSVGIEGRLASFGGDVTIFTLSVRATTRWGYF